MLYHMLYCIAQWKGWRGRSALRLETPAAARQVIGSNLAFSASHSSWSLTTINPDFPAWASGYKLRAGFSQERAFPRAMYLETSCPPSPWARPEYLDNGT